MRIVVLDYSGHVPQADLARNLAKFGHSVQHMYCSDYVSGRGVVERIDGDSPELNFVAISTNKKFNRYNFFQRVYHEIKISDAFWREIEVYDPHYSIFSNVPLFAMSRLSKKMIATRRPYIFWWQDVYSIAIGNSFRNFGHLKSIFEKPLQNIEKRIVEGANAVVAITPNFKSIYTLWNLDLTKFHVYPNWTPPMLFSNIEITRPKKLEKIVVYAGTLGLKHRPELLIGLADDKDFINLEFKLVVVSQGYGRKILEKQENRRANIELRDFLPIGDLAKLFQEASVLLAVLEPEASKYSVPSKIMSYLSSGKPIVASIDPNNASAIILNEARAGIIVHPDAPISEFSEAVTRIIKDKKLHSSMSEASENYAKQNFDGTKAAKFFLELLAE